MTLIKKLLIENKLTVWLMGFLRTKIFGFCQKAGVLQDNPSL
jgi:hypothetical protein